MKILIGIVSYMRHIKLNRLLTSIYKSNFKNFDIFIAYDNNDWDSAIRIAHSKFRHTAFIRDKHCYIGGNWNHLINHGMNAYPHIKFDAFLPLVDDIELFPDCLDKLVDDMTLLYPDTDGIIGITQEDKQRSFVPAGQCLIGKKFIERFKAINYQVYCPDYTHWFIDSELHEYACSLNKFALSSNAKLIHYNPSVYKEEQDETHKITRSEIMRIDKETRRKRVEKGLTWGKSWERVN